jgi:hypothetical protein
MPAATAAEWLTAAAIGTGAFLPGALVILGLDHQLPRVSLAPARAVAHRAHDAAEHAALKARVQLAAWLLVLACHLEQPQEGAR